MNLKNKSKKMLKNRNHYFFTLSLTHRLLSADSPHTCTINNEWLDKLHHVHRCEWEGLL